MKTVFNKPSRDDSYRHLTRPLHLGRGPEVDFDIPGRHRVRWVGCSAGILTLSAFLEVSVLPSRAQPNAAQLGFTGDTNIAVRAASEWQSDTNLLAAELIWSRPSEERASRELKLEFEPKDERSLSSILGKVATKRAESTLASARVLAEDVSSVNRGTSASRSPAELADHRVTSVFRETARESVGDYVKANYHPGGIIEVVRETLLDDSFDKRIVSPLSPAYAGNPGAAYAKKGDIHFGLRNIWSTHPRGFVTFSDKVEIDVTRSNPSLTLRDPLYLNYSDNHKALVTALAVNYPDWQVDKWSIPSVGATLSYVYNNESVNLTAGAGKCNFGSSHGGVESRYGEQVMLYAQCTF